MMQDDGKIGEHIDYKGRINQSGCSNCSTDPNNDHGDHVAGTIMGAGNINPTSKGMAYGAELLVYGSSNNNYNAVPNLYNNEGLVITSKSYSSTCNGGYDNLTRSLDEMTNDLNSIIHVFSAGNAGQDDCGYGPSGWGNITGGHKSGKNVLAVGNLDGYDAINSSSSRGPATDGRIKPDICGVGTSVNSTIPGNTYGVKTGTSMSCPGVAGTIGQLYDAYRDLNGGNNPTSGLIKAAILNTGEDLGNPGPDFIYGWGRINARAAFELLRDGNYTRDTITQNENESIFLNVPASTKELRVMLYWTDVEGSTSAQFALVNDLNMFVVTPSNDTIYPWVLDPTPTVSSLTAIAERERDSINNMEQVTISNPASGSFEINIDGFNIPQGPQEYFIVYRISICSRRNNSYLSNRW
jgi:subtilisin family serine protease